MSKWTRKQQALSSGHFDMSASRIGQSPTGKASLPTRSQTHFAPTKQAHVRQVHTKKPPPKPRVFVVMYLPKGMKS